MQHSFTESWRTYGLKSNDQNNKNEDTTPQNLILDKFFHPNQKIYLNIQIIW